MRKQNLKRISSITLIIVSCIVFSSVTAFCAPKTPKPPPLTVYYDEASFLAALDAPVVVDFDSLPGGTVLTGAEFFTQGLTITHWDCKPLNIVSSPPITMPASQSFATLPNALSSSYSIDPNQEGYSRAVCCNTYYSGYSDNILFEFFQGASAAGIYIGENDVNGVGVRFFKRDGGLLYEEFFTPFNPLNVFIGIISEEPIGSVQSVEAADDEDGVFIDDIIYQLNVGLCP